MLREALDAGVSHDPFAGPALAAFFPITASQAEVWLAAQLGNDANLSFNEGLDIILRGALDEAALTGALRSVLARHECLRATFSADGAWVMVREQLEPPLERHDLRAAADPAAALAGLDTAEMLRPFDLEQGPLLRFSLVRTTDEEYHLLFVAHHLVCDGWSGAVVITEIADLYSAAVERRSPTLAEPARYGDYSVAEREFLDSETGREHERYWLNKLDQSPPTLDLPGDRPRPAQRSYGAGRIDHRLSADLLAALKKTGAAQGASLVTTMLAGFASLLHRLTGSEDLVIGLSAAGQSQYAMPDVVGHCVNLLPLRLRPRAGVSFVEFLRAARGEVLDAQDHQGITFGALIPQLKLVRDDSRPPLVSIIFNIDVRDDDIRHAGLEVEYRTMVRQFENFELYFNVVDNGRDLVLEVCYNRALFDAGTVHRRIAEFEALLDAACRDPQTPIGAINILGAAERERMLRGFNRTAVDVPDLGMHELIAEQCARTPARIALQAREVQLDYATLWQRAMSLAHALHAAGARPGVPIGVALERTWEMPVATLAIHLCGGAYLPLDPELPIERMAIYVDDAQPTLVLTQRAIAPNLSGLNCPLLCVEDLDWNRHDAFDWVRGRPDLPAYLIYTSGSTGQPKGVSVLQRGLVNCLLSIAREPGLGADDVVVAVTTLSFDIAACDMYLPFMVGARLVLADRETARDGTLLVALLAGADASFLQCTPATWRLLLSAGWSGSQRLLGVTTGEPMSRDLVPQVLPLVRQLWNLYGPTETTIWSTGCRITDPAAPILIGRPIANTQCYVLDAGNQPQPEGAVGELWIAGDGVAAGYLKRPELTADRFVADPFAAVPGARMYRTGDLARWLPDGQIECLGRVDFQVKLRGYRIELGEIEAELNGHPGIAESLCGVRERAAGDPRLVAWVVRRENTNVSAGELREHLRRRLPGYMVPQTYRPLDRLPRLANGKLDRRSLPDPFVDAEAPAAAKKQPVTPTQRAVRDVWTQVLGMDDIGIDDRFFDLGGHSLLAIQTATTLQQRFGPRLPLRTIMMEPLRGIAAALDEALGPAPGQATSQSPGQGAAPPAMNTEQLPPASAGPAPSASAALADATPAVAPDTPLLSRLRRWLGQ